MQLDIYQVDAFASGAFTGNPAALVPLTSWLSDETLQRIAEENNLSETAYFIEEAQGKYEIRWFTPTKEVDLCGHATLAAGHLILTILSPSLNRVDFKCRSGHLSVEKKGDSLLMKLPRDEPTVVTSETVKAAISEAIHLPVLDVVKGVSDYLAVISDEEQLLSLNIDLEKVAALDARGLIVSVQGKGDLDIRSRCFYPAYGIKEDPFTGSAHCTLACYWTAKLNKQQLKARQDSKRGGVATIDLLPDAVQMESKCYTYLKGVIYI